MFNLRQHFSIKQLVTFGPLLLLLALSLVLGVASYRSEYANAMRAIEVARISAQPVLNLMKISVGGGNYANVQEEQALSLYRANAKLLFFSVQGKTDEKQEPYGVVYAAEGSKLLRSVHPENYAAGIEQKIARAEEALRNPGLEAERRGAIEGILTEQRQALHTYQEEKGQSERLLRDYARPSAQQVHDNYYLDREKGQLHLMLPTDNPGGGELWMVLDASEIAQVWKAILWKVLPINIISMLIAGLLAWRLAREIITPLEAMATTINAIETSSDLTLRLKEDATDEIGQIAASLNKMLQKFQLILSDVNSSASQVSAAAEEMSLIVNEVSQGMQQQKNAAGQLATAITEMNTSVDGIAGHAQQAARTASNADQQAAEGRKEVEKTT